MGDVPSKYDEPLQPQREPLWVFDPKFCMKEETVLHLREKFFSWSGDDFKIKDPRNGTVWFMCEGKTFSFRDKKVLCDFAGNPILNIKETLMNLGVPDYKVYRGEHSEEQMFKLNAHWTMVKAKADTVVVNGHDKRQYQIVCKGNFNLHEAMIYIGEPKQGGVPIARIYRPENARSIFGGVHDYHVAISPNVDVSLIVTLCICMDEIKKDRND